MEKERKSRLINKLGKDWFELIGDEFDKEYMINLSKFIALEYKTKIIRPDNINLFRAFKETDPYKLKIVIVGQDPYPSSHANGIAFGTDQKTIPKSLALMRDRINIEVSWGRFLEDDYSLKYLCEQGVLLLNSRLTVVDKTPNSHSGIGWEQFINKVLSKLILVHPHLVFIAIGTSAKNIFREINFYSSHLVLQVEHPAYAARQEREWQSNNCFIDANEYLLHKRNGGIHW